VQFGFSAGAAFFATLAGWKGIELGAGLFAGLCAHSLLDLTNTYGVTVFAPFSRRRFCLEWIFFIDAIVLTGVAVALAFVLPRWLQYGVVPAGYPMAFFGFLSTYVLAKCILRRRAGAVCSGSKSLVPSALVPWRFFGTKGHERSISLLRVNAITGACSTISEIPILDDTFLSALNQVPEFRLMKEISPEYHVVQAASENEETRLLCRDLRMRNFDTRFGDLEVWLDSSRQVLRSRFHA
jgi:hypothetical protein